jgi:hypothetical protein
MDYLKKFYIYSIDDFDKFHKQAFPNASKATYLSFTQSLKRIEKIHNKTLPNLSLGFLKDPTELWEKLTASDYSQNTIITTFTNILKLLKLMDIPLHKYNKFLEILNYHSQKRQNESNEDLKEKLDFLPDFQSLREIIKTRIQNIDNNIQFSEMKHLLLMSIMILSVPMKANNYISMRSIFDGEPTKDNLNYLVHDDEDEQNFTFKYKTTTIKVVDKDLKKILSIWLNGYNPTNWLFISNEDSKKPMTGKELRLSIAIGSKDIFKISLGANDLRSAYMKYLVDLDPDMNQKIQLSKLLGYKNTDRLDLHKII